MLAQFLRGELSINGWNGWYFFETAYLFIGIARCWFWGFVKGLFSLWDF